MAPFLSPLCVQFADACQEARLVEAALLTLAIPSNELIYLFILFP